MDTPAAPPKNKTVNTPIDKVGITSRPVISAGEFEAIQEDLDLMLNYAIRRGIQLPTALSLVNNPDSETVIANYNTLVTSIAPATVQSIRFINNELNKDDSQRKWYQYSLFSKCLIIAGISLVALVLVGLFPDVNEKNQAEGILSSSGLTLFYNLVFVISASLIGVMFFLLKTISSKIKNYTLLPVDGHEVNATILIGVMSGFIVSELFTFTNFTLGDSVSMNRMTLALLGGFSSDAIFSILQGVVNKIKLFLTPAT